MDEKKLQQVADDLEFIKKAHIIDLLSRGLSQDDVASLLGVDQSTISTMFPKGLLKKAKGLNKGS